MEVGVESMSAGAEVVFEALGCTGGNIDWPEGVHGALHLIDGEQLVLPPVDRTQMARGDQRADIPDLPESGDAGDSVTVTVVDEAGS